MYLVWCNSKYNDKNDLKWLYNICTLYFYSNMLHIDIYFKGYNHFLIFDNWLFLQSISKKHLIFTIYM